jgi:hypothetical protein
MFGMACKGLRAHPASRPAKGEVIKKKLSRRSYQEEDWSHYGPAIRVAGTLIEIGYINLSLTPS